MTADIVQLNAPDRAIVERLRAVPKRPQTLAVELARMELPYKTNLAIAEVLGISVKMMQRVRGIYTRGSSELVQQVYEGRTSVNAAEAVVFPKRGTTDAARMRKRRSTADVVPLMPVLPSTAALTDKAREEVILACELIIALPRDEDVAGLLTTRAERQLLRRALQRLGGINAGLDL